MNGKEVYKTASVTYNWLFKYTKVSFELKNAPATFLRAMGEILATVRWKYALDYIDCIRIFKDKKGTSTTYRGIAQATIQRRDDNIVGKLLIL